MKKEDYEIAKRNGINKNLLYQRVNTYGWSVEKATTQKVESRGHMKNLHEKAKGVPYQTIVSRLKNGWTEDEACNTKPGTRRSLSKDKDYIDKAASVGIAYQTYYHRRRRGWSKEEASTIPVNMSRGRPKVMNTLTYGNSFVKQGYARDNVILLENLEFAMPKNQLAIVTHLHNEGKSYKEISELVKRNEYEVIIALLHQVKKGFNMRPLAKLF